MELDEPFKAIQIAEKCIAIAPQYVFGYLTLGRAQLNFGEPGKFRYWPCLVSDPCRNGPGDLQTSCSIFA